MHYGSITVTFSESVMSKHFDATLMTLQNGPAYHNSTYSTKIGHDYPITQIPISGNGYNVVFNATSMLIVIPAVDYAALILADNMATLTSNTYAIFGPSLSKTTDGQVASDAIVDGEGMQCSAVTADGLAPAFSNWQMDMDTGYMTLNFGEPVNASSFDATGINFQRAVNLGVTTDAETITLSNTNVTVLSSNGLVQQIDIGQANLNGK